MVAVTISVFYVNFFLIFHNALRESVFIGKVLIYIYCLGVIPTLHLNYIYVCIDILCIV